MPTTTANPATNGAEDSNAMGKDTNDGLSREIEALRADIAAVSDRLRNLGSAGMRTARAERRDKTLAMRDKSDEMIAELSHELSRIERRMNRAVRKKPVQTLSIAAGLGFLVALVMRR